MSKLYLHLSIYTWYILNLFRGSATLLLTKYKAHLVLAHRVGFFQLRRQMTAYGDYRYSHLIKSTCTGVFNTPKIALTFATPTTSALLVFLLVA